jgi:putative hydrolase
VGPGAGDPDEFAEAPLFREIRRILTSSTGPVNWELARQIGIASGREGRDDPDPSDADRRSHEEAVRVAELNVGRFTSLEPPSDVPEVRTVRIAEWVAENVEGLRDLLEPAAGKVTTAIREVSSDAMPENTGPIGGLLEQLSPLLLGAQVGTVLGFLAERVLAQYDIAVPRSGPARLLFVHTNISRFEHDWSLDPTDFRTFVAIHEVTHRFEFTRSWAAPRFRDLLDDFLSTLRIDVTGLAGRIGAMDPSDPEGMQRLLESEEGLFGAVLDEEQRIKLGRVQAFMAAAEGYGDHVAHGIGRELLPSYPRIEEAMRRYREEERGDPVFERLLGIEMKREQYAHGRRFCDTVAELTDESTLTRMWDSPDTMPSLPEIEEPRLWLARTV